MSQHKGDLVVHHDKEISGQVTGTTFVQSGATLVAHGQLAGGLIIETGGRAIVHGQVARNVVNHGQLTVYGQISGPVIGNPPTNAASLTSDQIVGSDLEVPFLGRTESWSSNLTRRVEHDERRLDRLEDGARQRFSHLIKRSF